LSPYRQSGQRPRITPADRLLWCFIAKFWSGWRAALYFVQPRTVTTWQKKRFRDHWRALSQPAKAGRPRISRELRNLIGRMWEANPTWGSPKIVAELAMPGIDVAKSTVEKYQPKRAGPSGYRRGHYGNGLSMAKCLCGKGDRDATPGTFRSRHRAQ
jgi:hypothetical protein